MSNIFFRLYAQHPIKKGKQIRLLFEVINPHTYPVYILSPRGIHESLQESPVYEPAIISFMQNRLGISAGWYYFRVNAKISQTILRTEDSIKAGAAGIWTKVLSLNTGTVPFIGMEVVVKDKFQTPVDNVMLYFYRSKDVFDKDPAPYANSLFTAKTNAAGFAGIYLIDPAIYYIRAIKILSSTVTLKGQGQIEVTNKVVPVPIMIE